MLLCWLTDTGAANNILDVEFTKKLKLPLIPTGQRGGGVGGFIHDIYSVGSVTFFYGNIRFSIDQFYSINLDTIKLALRAKGIQDDFQGILGFGFFKQNGCFIDYAGNRIFVEPS